MSSAERELNLHGKTVVVAGGTSGIGRATALELAQRGAEVVVIGRDRAKGAEVVRALEQTPAGAGAFVEADLALIAETRRVARALTARLSRLDALILSAGAIQFEAQLTSEKLDRMFVTNFLHRVALAEELAPLLAKGRGRMVSIVADVPDWVHPDWANFEGERVYAGALGLVPLLAANLAAVQGWAEEWRARGIQVFAMHPGQVATDIYRGFKGWRSLGRIAMRPFQISVEKPARLAAWLAFSPDVQDASGALFPSVRRFTRRRTLARNGVERVLRTARGVLSEHAH
jgi:NAD(P)-dependent dehydrogenase (short-subunit alcohol dehydrogenase family)